MKVDVDDVVAVDPSSNNKLNRTMDGPVVVIANSIITTIKGHILMVRTIVPPILCNNIINIVLLLLSLLLNLLFLFLTRVPIVL